MGSSIWCWRTAPRLDGTCLRRVPEPLVGPSTDLLRLGPVTNGVYYDPYDGGINADPYPTFRRLRDEAPIYHNERHDIWALSRHADVEKGLTEWQTLSNSRSDILDIIKATKGGMQLPTGVILFEDPPLHTMHRSLMSRVFTPRRMNALEGEVRDFCAKCL